MKKRSRVLIIEDHPDTVAILRRQLIANGYHVFVAYDAASGLRRARRLAPDAIVLDLRLPEADGSKEQAEVGWTVLTKLKSDPKTRSIPIIIYSALDDVKRGLTLGADDYLIKPADAEMVGEVLERLLFPCEGSVLLVDDDADARDIYGRLLREHGLEVRTADGLATCLAELEREPPRLVVLDLLMPEGDGFAVLFHLRDNPLWRGIPVVVLTAKEITSDDREFLSGRVEDVLQKNGLEADQFVEQVLRHLRGSIADNQEASS